MIPARFAVGEVVEIAGVCDRGKWARVLEAEWDPGEPHSPDLEPSWVYRIDLRPDEWRYEVDLRELSTLERLAFEARDGDV